MNTDQSNERNAKRRSVAAVLLPQVDIGSMSSHSQYSKRLAHVRRIVQKDIEQRKRQQLLNYLEKQGFNDEGNTEIGDECEITLSVSDSLLGEMMDFNRIVRIEISEK